MDSGQLFGAVIVGGGLAGTTVAAELALSATPACPAGERAVRSPAFDASRGSRARLRRNGRFVRHRGRVSQASETPDGRILVGVEGPAGKSSFVVSCAVNCTGPNGDYRRVRHPLVQNLIRRGTIRPVVDAGGNNVDRFFTAGPPLRGCSTKRPPCRRRANEPPPSLERS